MEQFFPRGFALSNNKKIKKMVCSDKYWQIYLTNSDSFVLVVLENLHKMWIDEFLAPTGIFEELYYENNKYFVFLSSDNYLISSLKEGPYPETYEQIEAFSISFNTTTKLFSGVSLNNAIYIEEYSLILPTDNKTNASDNANVYGRWLTGGVNVSANSFGRISSLMSWISEDFLEKILKTAGFVVNKKTTQKASTETNPNQNSNNTEKNNSNFKNKGKFVLTGRPELEKFFNDNIVDIVLNKEQYEKMGISFPGATILHGPPGCGKTFAVDKLCEYLDWERYDINAASIASPYIHDTSKKISEIFELAINSAPSIIVIDEMEAFLSDRSAQNIGNHQVEETAEFLRKIPEAISKGVLIFAMTNIIDVIDPAILRRGRFDHIIEVDMATKEEINEILKERLKELPISKSIDIYKIAEKLDKHPLSDIAFVIREAGRLAVKNGSETITEECFESAVNSLPKTEDKKRIGFNQE